MFDGSKKKGVGQGVVVRLNYFELKMDKPLNKKSLKYCFQYY